MKDNKRLEKLQCRLTPKQVVLVWLEEISKFNNIIEYTKFARDLPESMRPATRVTTQVAQAVKESMPNQSKQAIQWAVRRAELDVCFLLRLHLQVNYYYMTEERVWAGLFATLEAGFKAISNEISRAQLAKCLAGIFSREMPYPVSQETADAIKAAIDNHVTTWEELQEDTFDEWILNYFIEKGATQLPGGTYDYKDGKWMPNVNTENEKEIKDCFNDVQEFERFKSGEDYTKGLADIKDSEYNRHYETIVSAMHQVVDSDRVEKGLEVYLETVPPLFLRWSPLIEGKWLDRKVVELAELGALIQAKGYQPNETNDDHPLAWPRYINNNGEEISRNEMLSLQKSIHKHLKNIPGKTIKISGRTYLDFEDYCSWKGRGLKGDLRPQIYEGFITSSWNKWLDTGAEDDCLTGIRVEKLGCYLKENDYQVFPSTVESRAENRLMLLSVLDKSATPHTEHEVEFWKELAILLLTKLYVFRQAATLIGRHYFDGRELLFPDLVRSLSELVRNTEEMVSLFNQEVGGNGEKINLETLRESTSASVRQQISYLVDLAKAEALDAMGEEKAAAELMIRYLD